MVLAKEYYSAPHARLVNLHASNSIISTAKYPTYTRHLPTDKHLLKTKHLPWQHLSKLKVVVLSAPPDSATEVIKVTWRLPTPSASAAQGNSTEKATRDRIPNKIFRVFEHYYFLMYTYLYVPEPSCGIKPDSDMLKEITSKWPTGDSLKESW